MDLKLLRRRCEERLQELGLSAPFSSQSFCQALAARRGKPLQVCPATSYASPWGVWIGTDAVDYIFFEQDTSPLHQEHIILHEAGHILFGHAPTQLADTDLLRRLLPNIPPETILRVLLRGSYSEFEEQEAEVLATIIQERQAGETASLQSSLAVETDEVIQRLLRYLQESS